METMIERMEQYNKNLENIVEDRTKDYLEEKRKVTIFSPENHKVILFLCLHLSF